MKDQERRKEIREMKLEELHNEDDRLRRELYDLKVKAVTESLENPMQIRDIRRDIARINTELTNRQSQEAKA